MKSIRFLAFVLLYCCSYSVMAQEKDQTEYGIDTCIHIDKIVVTSVTGSTNIKEIAAPITVISNAALQTYQSTNIIDAISRQPGINQITTGSGISKPVIRGLGYNRVLVINNGIRQEGQQWGDEHGIEIDGNSVSSVEIIKGPASLMYGSDAMAGVIIMNESPIMPLGKMCIEAGTEYQTNNDLTAYTLNYKGNKKGFVWNWRWSQKAAHDYYAPQDGFVPNSAFHENALNGMFGVTRKWGYARIKTNIYHFLPEMTEIEDGYEEGSKSYTIHAPFQDVRHLKIVSDNRAYLKNGYVNALFGFQQNRRQEFEDVDDCGLDFRLNTATYDVRYVSTKWNDFKLNYGFGGMYQTSDNLGEEFLIPEYNLFDIGAYFTAHRSFFSNLHVSGGLRFDNRNLHSFSLVDDGEERFTEIQRNFGALSGSLGLIYNTSPNFDIKINVSHGFRAPNISELGCNGEHEGTFRYELGNAELDPEQSLQFDCGLDFKQKFLSASLALFANRIGDYIYLQRLQYDKDEMPVFQYTAGDVRIFGGEARLVLHILKHLHYENVFSYVNAQLLEQKTYLPFIPAPRLVSTLHYDIATKSESIKNIFVEVESDGNFEQSNVMSSNGTETPTSSYILLNVHCGMELYLKSGKKLCSISVNATNLLDCAYQSHLSRLKYADTYSYTGRYGINNMGRNIGCKILFPIEIEPKTPEQKQ